MIKTIQKTSYKVNLRASYETFVEEAKKAYDDRQMEIPWDDDTEFETISAVENLVELKLADLMIEDKSEKV